MNDSILKNILEPISDNLTQLNQNLINNVGSENSFIKKISEQIILAGGKRLRPALVFLIAGLTDNQNNDNINKLAEAVELIHTATLIHDDVIDDADKRRNVQTINNLWDEKTAVLAGDYLLSLALIRIGEIQNPDLLVLFANVMKEICVGEIQQNLQTKKIISIEDYLEKSKRKTALLFMLAAKGASMLVCNSKEETEAAHNYGLNLGVAFQIADDILNFKTAKDKPVQNDLQSGIVTAPVIYTSEHSPSITPLLEKEELSQSELELIFEAVNTSNAIEKSYELAQGYVEKSKTAITVFVDNDYKNSLIKLADFSLKRTF